MFNKIITVKTFDGTIAEKSQCRYIKGEYFIKEKQCFFIDGKWYRINSGVIVKDYETNEYLLKSLLRNQVYGIVDYIDSKIVYGYFTRNIFTNEIGLIINSDERISQQDILNSDIATKCGLKRDKRTTVWYNKKVNPLHALGFSSGNSPFRIARSIFKNPLEYQAGPSINKFTNYYNQYTSKYGDYGLESKFYKEVGGYSWGIEYETYDGIIPENELIKTGLIPLRDGSLDGGIEYTTIPLHGQSGLGVINKQCELLKEHTLINSNCSMHIHVGGFKLDKETIVSLYVLNYILQNDIFKMFPVSYCKSSIIKRQDYNKPLPILGVNKTISCDDYFNKIFKFLDPNTKFKTFGKTHSNDPENRSKWYIKSRYHFVNFIPTIFNNSGTIEYRVHTPTQNSTKVINWLFILIGIIKFAEKNKLLISENIYKFLHSGINLSEILNSVYSEELATYLVTYTENRIEYYDHIYKTIKEISGSYEIQHDHKCNSPKALIV